MKVDFIKKKLYLIDQLISKVLNLMEFIRLKIESLKTCHGHAFLKLDDILDTFESS